MTFEFWYMLPVSVLFATIAMASGVGGATFFSPFFILVLRLSPDVAIGTGLITEVFGFSSGVFSYSRKKLIDYKLGMALLVVTVPMALAGTWIAGKIDPVFLKVILGVGLIAVALSFLRSPHQDDIARDDKIIEKEYGGENAERCLTSRKGERICYTVCNRTEGRIISGIGGLFVGMISTGMGEMNGYYLMQRCKVPSKVSVATSVFIVSLTAVSAASGHLFRFITTGGDLIHMVGNIVIFTVPGVIIGAQLGSLIASRISQRTLETGLSVLFIMVSAVTLAEVLI